MRIASFLLVLITAPALAVETSYWRQTSAADFKAGTMENVVASNLGDLKLSRALKTLLEQDPRIGSISALAEAPDGTIYAGAGPHGVLLAIKGESVSTVLDLGEAIHIFSLVVDPAGAVYLGTGGEKGLVYKIDKPGDKPRELLRSEKVQYVWALARTPDGNVYAATGPEGQLFEIKPDGGSKVLFDSDENNLLSMVSDGKDLLYVGTDPHGLVFKINRSTGASFAMYNAAESEISALTLDGKGNLYAATAEAREEGTPARMPEANGVEGRPESVPAGQPLPDERPKTPAPLPPAEGNPLRPDSIPRGASASREPRSLVRFAGYSQSVEPRLVSVADSPPGAPRRKPRPEPGPNPAPPEKPQPHPVPTQPSAPTPRPPAKPAPVPDAADTGEAKAEGNAIYRIDPDGFVTEIYRQDALIFAMVEDHGNLLLASGDSTGGQVVEVRPDTEETLILATIDAKQVLCLLPARDGRVYVGAANEGAVLTMAPGFASKGTFISPVFDATQISRFGKAQLHGLLPPGAGLTFATRSGNVRDGSDKGWSGWSDETKAIEFVPVSSPSARFLQYRLTLTSSDAKSTPVVEDVSIAYQSPNLAPQIKSIKLAQADADAASDAEASSRAPQPAPRQTISWEAADANNDPLTFRLWFRRAGDGPWIALKEKLTEPKFDWDTRTVADGRYEVRVEASDAAANAAGQGKTASRVSEPFLVDNTPPAIGDLKSTITGSITHIDLKAVDRTSTVASVEYSVDSAREWQLVLPIDGIYDSPEESVGFDVTGLLAGPHQIAIRATDAKGNRSLESIVLTIAPAVGAK